MDGTNLLSPDNLSIVVLCPDCNIGGFKNTANSIKADFPKTPYLGVVPAKSTASEVADMARYGPVAKGGDTITSLMSVGIRECDRDWCLLVTCGSWLRYSTFKKYLTFAKSDKDILYPVIDRKNIFHEASINGILMARKAFDDIGPFVECEDLSESKMFWAAGAIYKGYNFKALIGARFI